MAISSWRLDWFCLCPIDRLAEDGRHVTVDFPDLSVTVQNFRGGLRGFWNVCSHRGTKLRVAGCGHGLLRCPYHGWLYNADGVPVGIPDNDRQYGLDAAARKALALRAITVERLGRWVFARIDLVGATLADTLGDQAAFIAASPAADDTLVGEPGSPTNGDALTAPGFGNLRIRRQPGETLAEITLPAGEGGMVLSRFVFRATSEAL
jgi:phenylpropionate dioxygenase-like ring-hydroxylating dioxygenase large terminal subunit